MKVRAASILATMLTVAVGLAACAGEEEAPTPTVIHVTATPSATATATEAAATPTATTSPAATMPPVHGAGTRRGDPAVDAILDAFDSHDYEALARLTDTLEYPCDDAQPFLWCRPGQEQGDIIRGVWAGDVEGAITPPEKYAELAQQFQESYYGVPELFAAYRLHSAELADTSITFVTRWHGAPHYSALRLRDGLITTYSFYAGPPPEDLLADWSHPDWILPPVDMVQTYPWSARTGVEVVDEVLAAIEIDDAPGLAERTAVLERPCEEARPISPQPFVCPEGQEVGTPIRGVWIIDVEGGFWPPDRYQAAAELFLETVGRVHSVYRVDHDEADTLIVLRAREVDQHTWLELRLLAGEITGYVYSAGPPPDDLLADPSHPDWILRPAGVAR